MDNVSEYFQKRPKLKNSKILQYFFLYDNIKKIVKGAKTYEKIALKSNNGITLITLVVTIIVLLILARRSYVYTSRR